MTCKNVATESGSVESDGPVCSGFGKNRKSSGEGEELNDEAELRACFLHVADD